MIRNIRERDIEGYLLKRITESGGVCYKFTSPQNSGIPDRIVIIKGYVLFIELKAPGKKPRPLQIKKHKEMRKVGAVVMVIDSKEQIDNLIDFIKTKRTKKSICIPNDITSH